jgi:hypothetical protein
VVRFYREVENKNAYPFMLNTTNIHNIGIFIVVFVCFPPIVVGGERQKLRPLSFEEDH